MADTVVFTQGFESDDGGYTHGGVSDAWQWGPAVGTPSAGHLSSNCWGTALSGDVASGVDCYLVSPAYAVPALGAGESAYIQFFGWAGIADNNGIIKFDVSSDGVNWVNKCEVNDYYSKMWRLYSFDVSQYAGNNLYLRFSLRTSSALRGFFVDDVSLVISYVDVSGKLLTLNAYEAASDSCPWIYSWNGKAFVADNDIYSTARGAGKEYTDYYTLKTPVVAKDGLYTFDIREVNGESSFTDLAQLITVDHAAGVKVSNDEKGNIWTYVAPAQSSSAVDASGNNVLGQVGTQDGNGIKLYNGNYVLLDFSNQDVSQGATLVLSAKGFLSDAEIGNEIAAPPRIFVQTKDAAGNWVTVGTFYPRMEWATNAYNLAEHLGNSKVVRLFATSCNEGKYHVLDYAGLDTAPQAPIVVNAVSPVIATSNANGDVWNEIVASDGNYATMDPSQIISVAFPVPMTAGAVRDMVFVSKGYYVPHGTFEISTWDGSSWALRYKWTIAGSIGFQTKVFDMSQWLPDADGKYKVRVWQDYMTGIAAIDYAVLSKGGTTFSMIATDLGRPSDVTSAVSSIDGVTVNWGAAYEDDREDYDGEESDDYRIVQLTMGVPVEVVDTSSTPTVSFPMPNPDWWYNGTNPYASQTVVTTPEPTIVPTQTPSSGTGGNGSIATATPTTTPTLTPTPTPVPMSSGNDSLSANLWWILLLLLVAAAIGVWYVTKQK